MKHGPLCAIGHNLADSLMSGCFIVGYCSIDMFGEARASGGVIEVDFLHGRILRGTGSEDLRNVLTLFAENLPSFCARNSADAADFETLTASYFTTALGDRVSLSVADRTGRKSVTEYVGWPLKRVRTLDHLRRVRRMPRQMSVRA